MPPIPDDELELVVLDVDELEAPPDEELEDELDAPLDEAAPEVDDDDSPLDVEVDVLDEPEDVVVSLPPPHPA